MALPFLINLIHNNGSEEVVRRGKKIHFSGNVELIENNEFLGNIILRVKDDTYTTYYKVFIHNFKDERNINLRCTCPYNLTEICRHKAGALFFLQDLIDRNLLGSDNRAFNQQHTILKNEATGFKVY
jgi:uncharacterized Zn finger protein